jgi:hypothetical protein
MTFVQWGAFGFGLILGWFLYFVNRYRTGTIQLSDITTVIGALGGAAVLSLFPAGTELFGAYGVGLAAGFFGYFLVLVILVVRSPNFDADWFLDARRRDPGDGFGYDPQRPQHPMFVPPGFHGVNPGVTQQFFIGDQSASPVAATTRPGAAQ